MNKRPQNEARPRGSLLRRLTLSLLSALLLCALIPAAAVPTQALDWMTPYLDNAVQYGILREDLIDNPQPNQTITRGEFVAMVNRAYGYEDPGPTPFTDVPLEAWYHDDVGIAYNIGYFKGTSPTTASPENHLTREQAAVILARNLMLEERSGEVLGFSDSRKFSSWSRGVIEAVAEEGVILGFPDGSYRPQEDVTRVQVAVMLMRAVGTPLNEEGVYAGRNYSGNVTITSPNVKLKDAVIDGDLYISGGVDLGGIELENVTVLGRIVVSGGGESEKGKRSVILRNVTADELLVDSITNQFVTLQAEGFTDIPVANVRTHAYIEDLTENGRGLRLINLEGEEGATFQLAGNIKNAVNLTPLSTLNIAQGIAQIVTIDEKAIDSTLNIDGSAEVGTLNLDVGTKVTGTGDISHLEVNAPGCEVEMLPDTITIRPGIEATIDGEKMNTQDAIESSEDPRLLTGYPAAKNVAPTSATAVFSTNKRGTVHWAISAVTSGSVSEEDLIEPPSYGGNIIKSGKVDVAASKTEYTVPLTGLTKAGSYYITAMLVDNRGYRSPIKVTAFTTPDDTVPAFINENTYTILVDGDDNEQILQAMVMANKSCIMYYALLPKGSVAPTPADFRANAVTGNLGFGTVELIKNTPFLVTRVNNIRLQEETTYDLYLWLTDADGAKSSAVKKITVTTKDRTPPVLQQLIHTGETANSVTLTFAMDEPGTLYWAVVKRGGNFFTDVNRVEIDADPNAVNPKIQVESGLNSLKKGSARTSAAMTSVAFTIGGLDPQTAYDVYYVIKDLAGNYGLYSGTLATGLKANAYDMPFPISTLDNAPPTVVQEFTHDATSDPAHPTPFPDTSVRLVFSEHVKGVAQGPDGTYASDIFLTEYRKLLNGQITESEWGQLIEKYFTLHILGQTDAAPARQYSIDGIPTNDPWVVDYRKVTVAEDPSGTGKLIITFPTNPDNAALSALNLSGGTTYYFTLVDIADTASNRLQYNTTYHYEVTHFTTISAQIYLARQYPGVPDEHEPSNPATTDPWYFDYAFSATPLSHQSMADETDWDLMVWSDTSINFKVYESVDGGQTWIPLPGEARISTNGTLLGASIGSLRQKDQVVDGVPQTGQYHQLNSMEERLYAIQITSMGTAGSTRNNWNSTLSLRVTAVSGVEGALGAASSLLENSSEYDAAIGSNSAVTDITTPSVFTMSQTFTDSTPPNFITGFPKLNAGDSQVGMEVALDRTDSRYYWVVAPVSSIPTYIDDGSASGTLLNADNWSTFFGNGQQHMALTPSSQSIMGFPVTPGSNVKKGSAEYIGDATPFVVDGLQPLTKYVAYFVLQGRAQNSYSPQVYCFGFETGDVDTPIIILTNKSPHVGLETTTDSLGAWWLISAELANQHPTLGDKFTTYIGDNEHGTAAENKTAFNTVFRTHFTSTTSHPNADSVKVIEALSTSVGGVDTMSLFDRYASSDSKDAMQRMILAGDAGATYTATTGDFDRDANREEDVNTMAPHMRPITQYYFVAAGKNTMGTKYAFKAIGNIRLVDTNPPDVSIAYHEFTSITDAAGKDVLKGEVDLETYLKNPGLYKHAGTITVTFTKQPYLKLQSGTSIDPQELSGNVTDIVRNGNSMVTAANVDGMTLTITFSNLSAANYQLALFGNGWISDVYGNTEQQRLILWFDIPLVTTTPLTKLPELQYGWENEI